MARPTVTFTWRQPPSAAWNPDRYMTRLSEGVFSYLQYVGAATLQSDARNYAVWKDWTGNARQTLAAFAVNVGPSGSVPATFTGDEESQLSMVYGPGPNRACLILRQTMSYGKWLELRHQGRYAIVMRVIQMNQRKIWADIKNIVEG